MWSDWDDLCEQHKMTLKRFRVSDLVRIIKWCWIIARPFSEFWSSNSMGTTELLHD